jgi:hypothetical protein
MITLNCCDNPEITLGVESAIDGFQSYSICRNCKQKTVHFTNFIEELTPPTPEEVFQRVIDLVHRDRNLGIPFENWLMQYKDEILKGTK